MASRAALVLSRVLQAGRWAPLLYGANVIVARNLEMCVIADAIRKAAGSSALLVYECLDVHRTLSGNGLASKALRALEARILKRSSALILSSPGFLTHHFEKHHLPYPRVVMAENKRVMLDGMDERSRPPIAPGPPWRLAWFGALRCAKSFELLHALAKRRPDLVDIEMRGLPTRELQTLIDTHPKLPNMRFGGRYDQSELARMYQARHITWAVDYTERGQNSDWLLPNRIYEGGVFGLPTAALADTQMARWLGDRGTGLVFRDPATELEGVLDRLDEAGYRALERSAMAVPLSDLIWTREDCARLTAEIAGAPAS